jgi:glutamate synthase domain-containing protein 1
MIALNDRIKLRPMTAARHGERVFVASEEAAIRTICEQPDEVWNMAAGEPLVATVKGITNNNIRFVEDESSNNEKTLARPA